MIFWRSAERLDAELDLKASTLLELRSSLSPILDWVIANESEAEIRVFIQWDMAIWKLHDSLMRDRARVDDAQLLNDIRIRTKFHRIEYAHLLRELESFKSKNWWLEANRRTENDRP